MLVTWRFCFFTVKPNKTDVTFINHPAVVGERATVKCSSNGRPEPSYTIIHNDSITVSNQSTYFINEVKWSDAGTYKCIATNKLGSDSASKNLTVGKIRLFYLLILSQHKNSCAAKSRLLSLQNILYY